MHVKDYFFYTAIPPGFIQPKEINNDEMAPYAELKISKRTFKELPFLPLSQEKKSLRTLQWEWSNVGRQRILCNLKESCIQYTRPILFLYVFSPSRDPSPVFRCLERLPRILHQFSNLTSNSHYMRFLKLNFGKNKQISFIAARYTRSRPTSPVWFSTFVYSGTLKKPCKFGVKWYPSLLTHCNF